jgi:hypothetical protein
MEKMKFSDGVEIDTSGAYRTLQLHDGWYVVGEGLLAPCKDEEDAKQLRDELSSRSPAAD